LNKLLQVEIPENLSILNLYFVPVVSASGAFVGSDPGYNNNNNDDDRTMNAAVSDIFKNSMFPSFGSNDNSSLPFQKTNSGPLSGIPTSNPVPPPRNPEDNLFYLSASTAVRENAPSLSQILADTFEDKKHSKRSKKDKSHKSSKVDINKREMLPAGAMSSDDDVATKPKNKREKVPGNVQITRRKGKDDVRSSLFILIFV
jgi:hypothetical protein